MFSRSLERVNVSSITIRTPLTEVFNKVRKIFGKYSAPLSSVISHDEATGADPKTTAGLLAEHFASVSRKDPIPLMVVHHRHLKSVGVKFASSGDESYNVPFSLSGL